MPRRIEEPITVPDPSPGREDQTVTTHPAFAQIRASRVTGTTNLYGSDFSHNNYITITIYGSKLFRDLSHDWTYANRELIEVSMSEAQWATFVSAMNVGGGVQCTISHIQGERMPELPPPISRADQFADEMHKTVESSRKALRELRDEVVAMGLPKGKTKQILDSISHASMQLDSNAPYVAKCFDEHVEKGIETAKAEIHGYMIGAVARAGITALSQAEAPLVLDSQESSPPHLP